MRLRQVAMMGAVITAAMAGLSTARLSRVRVAAAPAAHTTYVPLPRANAFAQTSGRTCLLVPGGEISGTVSQRDQAVPDGTPVFATFSGGPTVNDVTAGRSLLPSAPRSGLLRWCALD